MDPSTIIIILFVFGAVFGSFLNVVTLRYDGEHFLFDTKMLGGRSRCPHCEKTLRWFELVPIVSFLIQGGRCRRCGARLGIQYPIVEFISGLIFVFVPFSFGAIAAPVIFVTTVLWVAVFEALLVMAAIDIRLGIIPDEINIFLGVLGIFFAILSASQGHPVLLKLIGAAAAGIFFAILIAATRGKGMGMGDLKLAIPLGLLFGWPYIIFVLVAAFVFGAVAGMIAIARGAKTMKGTLPFGPYLAAGAATAFFWGAPIVAWYLSLLGIR
jgi:prepilin signal peptidase PulO-like enzyme (type II secretory pathway)